MNSEADRETALGGFFAANRDHVVIAPAFLVKLESAVGLLAGNVDSLFFQHLDNQGIDRPGLQSGAFHLEAI